MAGPPRVLTNYNLWLAEKSLMVPGAHPRAGQLMWCGVLIGWFESRNTVTILAADSSHGILDIVAVEGASVNIYT